MSRSSGLRFRAWIVSAGDGERAGGDHRAALASAAAKLRRDRGVEVESELTLEDHPAPLPG
jgi:hypothetical protein